MAASVDVPDRLAPDTVSTSPLKPRSSGVWCVEAELRPAGMTSTVEPFLNQQPLP
jgi:hypothetical protein